MLFAPAMVGLITLLTFIDNHLKTDFVKNGYCFSDMTDFSFLVFTKDCFHSLLTSIYSLAGPLLLILEYMPYGDLLGYLRISRGHNDTYNSGEKKPTSRLTDMELLSFAWMIADGMSYLADMKVRLNQSFISYDANVACIFETSIHYHYCRHNI